MSEVVRESENVEGVDDGCTLHRRTAGNGVVASAVGLRCSSCCFGDVERDGESGSTELVRKRAVSSRDGCQQSRRQSKELDRALVDVKALKTEHAAVSAAVGCDCLIFFVAVAVAVAVDDNVNDNVNVNAAPSATTTKTWDDTTSEKGGLSASTKQDTRRASPRGRLSR